MLTTTSVLSIKILNNKSYNYYKRSPISKLPSLSLHYSINSLKMRIAIVTLLALFTSTVVSFKAQTHAIGTLSYPFTSLINLHIL